MHDRPDVLDTLVAQFTEPLACLRELIQNAVDAGSDVVEVAATRSEDDALGLLEVRDWGEGMDRAIIDQQLTRLFSSSKDGDLTKIGKFGIGFVSVFALKPEAVCVDTGRGGERWRVVFQPDRTFTRIRLDEPVEGTRVRLFLDRRGDDWERLVADARQTVRRWCRHLTQEVLFNGEPLNEPLGLPGHPVSRVIDDGAGTVVVVGVGAPVSIGFYNKGLTLLETTTWDDVPAGVSVRVSSRWLEHTLTRDSVVRDDHYEKAMKRLRAAVDDELVPAAWQAVADGAPPDVAGPLLQWLAGRPLSRRDRKRPLVHTVDGRTLSPADCADDAAWCAADDADECAVARALARDGGIVVALREGAAGDADAAALATIAQGRPWSRVGRRYVLASAIDDDGTAEAVRFAARAARLVEHAARLLDVAAPRRTHARPLHVARIRASSLGRGSAGTASARPLLYAADRATGALPLTPAPRVTGSVLDVDHPVLAPLLSLAARDTPLAAYLLAKAILPRPVAPDVEARLLDHAWQERQATIAPAAVRSPA
jgi:hypothetical protein